MYNHYENWIEFRKTKPGDCETNYIFHEELSLGESADIAKIQGGLNYHFCDIYMWHLLVNR